MARFSLNIKTCCLYVVWKTRSNLGKHFLHPQKHALPYTYGEDFLFLKAFIALNSYYPPALPLFQHPWKWGKNFSLWSLLCIWCRREMLL